MKRLFLFMIFFSMFSVQAICAAEGCQYDTQCKGDRVCQNGACVASKIDKATNSNNTNSNGSDGLSTTCEFYHGPKAGQKQHWPRNTPGLTPARVGDPCHDGMGSTGVAIEDE